MVAYLKAGVQVRTYSDYLRAAQETEKEDSKELPWGPRTQATNTPPKPRATSFFPLRKLKGNQPIPKSLLCIWHIWKNRMPVMMKTKRVMIPAESKGVMVELMVCLERAIKDAQADKKLLLPQ